MRYSLILVSLLFFPLNAQSNQASEHPSKKKGAHYSSQKNPLMKGHVKTILQKLFSNADLSRYDENIDSILDKEHATAEEINLLKIQGLLDVLGENIYAIIDESLEKEIVEGSQKGSSKKLFASMEGHLEKFSLGEELKEEFRKFFDFIEHLALGTVTEAKIPPQPSTIKSIDDFFTSEQFKRSQLSATGVIQKMNETLNKSKSRSKD